MATLLLDFRMALRSLMKTPLFTLTAVLTLALGVGASTAIFSLLNSVVFKSVPFPEPERLVWVWEDRGGQGLDKDRNKVSGGIFGRWNEQNRCFQQMAGVAPISMNLTGEGEATRLEGALASSNFFDLLRVKLARGRGFLPDEGQAVKGRVVVLSYGLWQRRFGGQEDLLGRGLRLGDEVYNVVGILPRVFGHPQKADFWIPIAANAEDWQGGYENHRWHVVARLKPGVTLAQARADLRVVNEVIKPIKPFWKAKWGATIWPFREAVIEGAPGTLWMLQGAVVLVLLIACVNVTNLVLVRAAARQREMALRAALGASRWDLVKLAQTESLLLALLGGCFGMLLAFGGTAFLKQLSSQFLPRAQEIGMEWPVLAFSLGITLVTGLLCSLGPAWSAARLDLNLSLKDGGKGSSSFGTQRLSRTLVMLEVALALTLLTGAGLMLRSFKRLSAVELGFDSSNLLTAQINISPSQYPQGPQVEGFLRQLQERIAATPGVVASGLSTDLPLVNAANTSTRLVTQSNEARIEPDYAYITPSYFETLGLPMLQGRTFQSAERDVVVVNQAFVQACMPGQNPLGQRVTEDGTQGWEIVGVVRDIRGRSQAKPAVPHIYLPMALTNWHRFELVVRTTGDPLAVLGGVQAAVHAIDARVPVGNVKTMNRILFEHVAEFRWLVTLAGGFALVALLLAAMGVYGVMGTSVARRTQEIGVRMALGAQRGEVLRLVLGQGMATVGLGLLLGLGGAFMVVRLLLSQDLLFQTEATDALTLTGVVLVLLFASILACCLPARKAMKVEPSEALRNE